MWHDSCICVTYACDTSLATRVAFFDSCVRETWLIHVGHDWFLYGTWLIRMWDMTRSYVGHDSFVCGTWLIYVWEMTLSYVWYTCAIRGLHREPFIYGTRLILNWDMTHWHIRNDLCVCVTYVCDPRVALWPIHIQDMTYSYVRHDSPTNGKWLIRMRDMCVILDLLCDPFIYVTRLILTWDMTRLYLWNDPFVCLKYVCDPSCCVAHLYMGIDEFLCDSLISDKWPIHTCDIHVWY